MNRGTVSQLMMTAAVFAAAAHATGASVTKAPFGTTADGKSVDKYTLTNDAGASIDVITFGGILTRVMMPDKAGHMGDVALGFDNLKQYETESPYFGALVGRFANRIAKGTFTVDGTTYHVPINNGVNSLHGGKIGYDKRVWEAKEVQSPDGPSLQLDLTDHDGDQGYPGTVKVTATYTLTQTNTIRIVYSAVTDKATPINLTNHSYWNLKDAGASVIDDHVLKTFAAHYTPVDATQIPTGEIAPTAGTPIDFSTAKPIGRDIKAMGGDPAGYDHNLVLAAHDPSKMVEAVAVWEPTTGREMQVWTTEPGCQFYSGNFLDGKVKGRGGVAYQMHSAFAFEAQHFPDSPNQKDFPSSILKPGETYHQTTEYRFAASPVSPF
jgi:aldose 1-epimerase